MLRIEVSRTTWLLLELIEVRGGTGEESTWRREIHGDISNTDLLRCHWVLYLLLLLLLLLLLFIKTSVSEENCIHVTHYAV